MTESELMSGLAARIAADRVRTTLLGIAARLSIELHGDPDRPKSAFSPVPLDLYGEGLPAEIRSSWLFALRGGFAHPPERHPNSVQRMFAFDSPGSFETWGGGGWVRHELVPGDDGLSIPIDTWHRMPSQDADWTVVSFHTVEPHELIEIVGDPETGAGGAARHYIPAV